MMGKVHNRNMFFFSSKFSSIFWGMLEIPNIFWGDLSDPVFIYFIFLEGGGGYRANAGAQPM